MSSSMLRVAERARRLVEYSGEGVYGDERAAPAA